MAVQSNVYVHSGCSAYFSLQTMFMSKLLNTDY